jgi:hypothetical protein
MSDPQEHLDRAWEAAQAHIDNAPDDQQALERAAAFKRAVNRLSGQATSKLKQTAMRIYQKQQYALQWMAEVTSMSKARMGQYVDPDEAAKAKAARQARKGK